MPWGLALGFRARDAELEKASRQCYSLRVLELRLGFRAKGTSFRVRSRFQFCGYTKSPTGTQQHLTHGARFYVSTRHYINTPHLLDVSMSTRPANITCRPHSRGALNSTPPPAPHNTSLTCGIVIITQPTHTRRTCGRYLNHTRWHNPQLHLTY